MNRTRNFRKPVSVLAYDDRHRRGAGEDIVISILRIASADLLPQIEALYLEAFPESERKPVSFLAALLGRPDYRLYALTRKDRVKAFAVAYVSPTGAFALLEYMAVVAGERGGGVGSELFRQVIDALGLSLFLEVEAIDEPPNADASAIRRKLFYRRLGCRTVAGLSYRMPRVSSADPPPMHLLTHGFDPPALRREDLRKWLEEIYLNVYSRPRNDPAIEEMLRGLPEKLNLT